jgi:hypothetical protein
MAEDQPSNSGGGSTVGPGMPGCPFPLASHPRMWPAMAVGGLGVLLGAAALVAALTRLTPELGLKAPTYSAAEIAVAHRQLCGSYQLEAKAVQIDMWGTDKALARIATTNGALMLDTVASNPGLDANHRDAARALESAYLAVTAESSYGVATDADFQAALDNVLAKDAAMKKACGGDDRLRVQ